ncbi:uncharacterized protein LOC125212150 [Salvia hispanica]|uniref:uncharacterized protein LOC125212150 n=1 Tax=Salvia hispanica TaxID=49212 RepID=UPI0020091B88|nr:uncharacterized protein LOC125212150 [Salvia hispanica]
MTLRRVTLRSFERCGSFGKRKAAIRFSSFITRLKKFNAPNKARPSYVSEVTWKGLLEHWKDPDVIEKSILTKKARLSEPDGPGTGYSKNYSYLQRLNFSCSKSSKVVVFHPNPSASPPPQKSPPQSLPAASSSTPPYPTSTPPMSSRPSQSPTSAAVAAAGARAGEAPPPAAVTVAVRGRGS